MLIDFDPDDYEVVTTHNTCNHHKRFPKDRSYAGCTCSGSYGLKKKKGPTKRQRFMNLYYTTTHGEQGMNKDAKYLRDMAKAIDENNGWRVKEILNHAQRLRDIADNLDSLDNDMVEIRGLVRPILQNAPMILEFATEQERDNGRS